MLRAKDNCYTAWKLKLTFGVWRWFIIADSLSRSLFIYNHENIHY